MTKIAVLASFNMDLVMRAERLPAPGETIQGDFAMYLGGKGFNQAIAAVRLGANVSVIGRVGDDDFGRRFVVALDQNHIERSGLTVDAAAGTGVAAIVVGPDGENAIIQSPRANRKLAAADVEAATDALSGAGAALLQLETSMEAAIAFGQRARSGGGRVIINPAPAAPVPDGLLRLAHVVVANAIETSTLVDVPVADPQSALAAAKALRARYGCDAVVTIGKQGAVAVTAGASFHLPAFNVDAVDTVGAGDAFCAALAVSLAEGASFEHSVRFANAAGALATTAAGAEPSMPSRQAVEHLARQQEITP